MVTRITFTSDDGEPDLRWPDLTTILRFENILHDQFAATQRKVHVMTHSLRNSGRVDSDVDPTSWKGVITYGGASPGSIHDPVKYARYEMNRSGTDRPGVNAEGEPSFDHDFMSPTRARRFHERYKRAIRAFLRGDD